MSELSVGELKGLLSNNNMITVPSGHQIVQSGMIIQTVQTVLSARQSYGSVTTWTDITGLSLSITPKFSTSKILISSSVIASISGATSINFRILKNGSAIGIGNTGNTGQCGWRIEVSNTAWANTGSYQYLDAPGTTSQLTYKVQVLPYYDGRTVTINNSYNGGAGDDLTGISTITAMEIAQ